MIRMFVQRGSHQELLLRPNASNAPLVGARLAQRECRSGLATSSILLTRHTSDSARPERLVTSTRSRSTASPARSALACWLTTDHLARLYDSGSGPICLLLWLGTVFERAWINSRRALNLLTSDIGSGNGGGDIDPVVIEALRAISPTINHSSPFTHPTGGSKVITALRRLREGGHAYDPDSLCEWARPVLVVTAR